MKSIIVKSKYDIIIVLNASERNQKTRLFDEYDKGLYLGGQTRMEAAAEICKNNMDSKIIVVGGLKDNPESIDDSKKTKDMEEYLLENVGKQINIQRINSLPCTKHNFIAIFIHWSANQIDLTEKKVAILTNYYHLPRTFKFLSNAIIDYGIKGSPIFIPIAAESIINKSEIYESKSTEFLKRLQGEVKGLSDLEKGEYKDPCLYKKEEYEKGKLENFINIIKSEGDMLLSEADKNSLLKYLNI